MTTTPTQVSGSSLRRLPAGRKAELAAFVAQTGEVTVADLADRFEVSTDTIRRDLDSLDAEGVLVRTHGGAVSIDAIPKPDTGVDVRVRLQAENKERIGVLAATLVHDDDAVIVNAGTTALTLTRTLSERRNLTIATNNLRLAAELSPAVYRDLYVFGGNLRHSAQATVGPVRIPATADGPEIDIRCDVALIGVGAVSVESGYSTSNVAEASMMSDMMDRADKVAILADQSKFGRRLFATIAGLGRADYLVTDAEPPTELRQALDSEGVELMIARR
ncbi:DeoR/GlpR family DNA-binding transcription regulator [Isoptericola sp. F-RaC21]|uniref:DeoR/GlpR family DNA-binding transcription regulator n=1 Tax=Isoptericola sp. F-RaC21 TaxID=3141452 RepID=UPI00315BEF3C